MLASWLPFLVSDIFGLFKYDCLLVTQCTTSMVLCCSRGGYAVNLNKLLSSAEESPMSAAAVWSLNPCMEDNLNSCADVDVLIFCE